MKTNESEKQIETLTSLVATLETDIACIQADLDRPVLDGTPFIVVLRRGQGALDTCRDFVFGENYPGQSTVTGRSFRFQREWHMAGAHCYTQDRATKFAKANCKPGVEIIAVHINDWKRQRIADKTSVLNDIRAGLAAMQK